MGAWRTVDGSIPSDAVAKVPAVTLGFWIIKILCTTLGETGGDTVSMSWLGETTPEAGQSALNGYLVGTLIFGLLLAVLAARRSARSALHIGSRSRFRRRWARRSGTGPPMAGSATPAAHWSSAQHSPFWPRSIFGRG